ncbi:hypothetical protein IB233_03195 [Comamonas sp. CMM01]|uniref:hypothetical protein n=1 Tax=Comamonas sp. CMM01 TaxID=2769280 RepID=UPI00177E76F3|nr:hypothetical protein [Comamonas sp. CMM01]MBD9530639.1 hypothetical protein [Comamonas sp. CMM01]
MIPVHKFFKSPGGEVFALLADGSQDAEIAARDLAPMSADELDAHRNPIHPIPVIAAGLQARVDAEYKRQMGLITAKYPEEERSSWYIQTAQAQAVISGSAVATPWLDACAQTRGMPREELAQRIIALDAQFQGMHGFLTGVRQWHEEAIGAIVAAAQSDEAQARADLANYDVMQGWSNDQTEPAPAL